MAKLNAPRTVAVDVRVPFVYATGLPYTTARTLLNIDLDDPDVRSDDLGVWTFNGDIELPHQKCAVTLTVPRRVFADEDTVVATSLPVIVG